ncbi:MAG: Biotin/lipoate A/B protein ligase [Geoglossum umbratile]|nr:MAG: Biotin/lipoate A/B protein ligase [Geoglossum umbratile]
MSLYTNSPSTILGRNPNPWVEVNLGLLNRARDSNNAVPAALGEEPPLLVRRRSGDGTVFHDHGNVNYSVITPSADFHRDKHASMVVRALRRLGITEVRVNDRHDIAIVSDPRETPRKISGSAYKLTRQRSLHHGTCLLSSPYLAAIPSYLRLLAKAYIKARGVESVSSPVANVGVRSREFERAVVAEFGDMYGIGGGVWEKISASKGICGGRGWVGGAIGEENLEVEEIARGAIELKSLDWIYAQTPQFTLSGHAMPEDPRGRPALPASLPLSTRVSITARSCAITSSHISVSSDPTRAEIQAAELHASLKGKRIHEVADLESS